jgi:hypothetical protein
MPFRQAVTVKLSYPIGPACDDLLRNSFRLAVVAAP